MEPDPTKADLQMDYVKRTRYGLVKYHKCLVVPGKQENVIIYRTL